MDPIRNPYTPGAGTPPPELAGRDEIRSTALVALQLLTRSKRSAETQQIDRFEQVRLPLAVLSDQEHAVLTFKTVQAERLQVAKALETHGREARPPRRQSQGGR